MVDTPRAQRVVDTALGWGISTAPAAARVIRVAAGVALVPAVATWRLVRRPPLLPEALTPAATVARWEARGASARTATIEQTTALVALVLDHVAPTVVTGVIERLDTERLIRTLVTRETVDAALAQIDLPHVIAEVLTPEVTDAVVQQLDLLQLVEDHLHDSLVEDLVTMVLPPVMSAVLANLDLTQLVRENVDLATIANDVVEQINLAAITNDVIEQINLPEIIRDSTSGVAGELVESTRAGAASADEAIARFFRLRRGQP